MNVTISISTRWKRIWKDGCESHCLHGPRENTTQALPSLLGLLLLSTPSATTAQQATNFNYATNGNEITITRYTGTDDAVVIPSIIDGLPVTSIGTNAFWGTSITAVTIPDSVTTIGDSAFSACPLTSVIIPESVISIGTNAFFDCFYLVDLTLGNSVRTIGNGAFSGEMFDKGYPSGGFWYSQGCPLTSVTIPNGVTNIGTEAFYYCTSLTNLTLGNSVAIIGDSAFSGCGLTGVTISSNVTSIGDQAFAACTGLAAINVDVRNAHYSSLNGILLDKSQTILIQYPAARSGSYSVPSNVAAIGDYAFAYSASLTNVIISHPVTGIGDYAFAWCGGLSSVTIPASVTTIGNCAFVGCGLTNVTIPDSVTSIGAEAFRYCVFLDGILFDGNAPNIGGDGTLNGAASSGKFWIPTVYYLAGAEGWSNSFAGCPALLWNPTAQSIGVQANQFGFDISGTTNIPILVEASTDLGAGTWVPLQTSILTNGISHFSDTLWTNYPTRLYRLSFLSVGAPHWDCNGPDCD